MIVPQKDIEHLEWIYKRLVHVYNESPNTDFVHRLFEIIQTLKHQPTS